MLLETLAVMAVSAAAPQDFQARVAPRGDYRQSCSGEFVNRGRLYADCRTERGQIVGTSIELNRCGDYEIRNRDGLLTCGPYRGEYERADGRPGYPGGYPGNGNPGTPGWPGGGGGGGWGRNTITVYRDADFRGASTTWQGEIADLGRSGFNDQISSMRFNGRWEACVHANFQGRCQVFTGDVRNLREYGMNDVISSLRPVRGGGRW